MNKSFSGQALRYSKSSPCFHPDVALAKRGRDKKFVFFGSSPFSIFSLEVLKDKKNLPKLVVTLPDRPKGRGLKKEANVVKAWAVENDLPVMEVEKLSDKELSEIKKISPDFLLVSAFGLVFPSVFLEFFAGKIINIHPSLLPKYRGPAPLQDLILNNDKSSAGVSIILLEKRLDSGPIITQKIYDGEWPINTLALGENLFKSGTELLLEKIDDFLIGRIKPKIQNENLATFTKKISKSDGEIDLADDDFKNYLKYLAYFPWPGVYFFADRKGQKTRFVIKKADFQDGKFQIKRVSPEGEKEIDFSDRVNCL